MEFLGHRRTADNRAALEHADRHAGRGEIRGTDETVVPAADDHGVVHDDVRYSVSPAATFENPQSTYVISPVIALDSEEK